MKLTVPIQCVTRTVAECRGAVKSRARRTATPGLYAESAIASPVSYHEENPAAAVIIFETVGRMLIVERPLSRGPWRTATLLAVLSISAFGQCGVERWSVKTGTDPDAALVNLNVVTPSTIGELRALPAPATEPRSRLRPVETTQYWVSATLTKFKLEDDSDYHVVLADALGNTIIVELPHPKCVGAGSPFTAGIVNARSQFDARFKATTSFQNVNVPVQVLGVGFFDALHGQTGVAPNGIELHPVLDLVFGPTITSINTA